MRTSLRQLLTTGSVLLADGATGTNYFDMGLGPGDPPELWNVEHPERVTALHQAFVDAGADIILTNTFGANRSRLALHGNEHRVRELAERAAALARAVADASPRPVVVAGSVGPTGELFAPLGALTSAVADEVFHEQCAGLRDGGADVVWIETMSAPEEVRSAARGAIAAGLPYAATCSFDTAGRTMMGVLPDELAAMFDGLAVPPLAFGANCGVGASDILFTVLAMSAAATGAAATGEVGERPVLICKGNCGIPRFEGAEAMYTGTPELMADYARLAADAGARIIGGCCGTTPVHLAAMRQALDTRVPRARPTLEEVIAAIGPLVNTPPTALPTEGRERRRRRA